MILFDKKHVNFLIKTLAIADIALAILYFLSGFAMMFRTHAPIPGKIMYFLGYEIMGLFAFAFIYILLAVFHKIVNKDT